MALASEFQFRAPDRRYVWGHLALTMSQAAALTGVSERQIQHWMDKGYIGSAAAGGRKVNGEGLDCIMLIKQARAAGLSLRQAVPMAHRYLDREKVGGLQADVTSSMTGELLDRLSGARSSIDSALGVLQTVAGYGAHRVDVSLPASLENRVSSQRGRQAP
jgi:DNA-binding transcriptional MerR regulator